MPPQANAELWPESRISKNQGRGIDFMLEGSGSLLLADPGVGKTVMYLTAAKRALERFASVDRLLFVAPLEVARITIPKEILKWAHLQDLSFECIASVPLEDRIRVLRNPPQVTIVNYDGLAGAERYLPERKLKDGTVRPAKTLQPQGLFDLFKFSAGKRGLVWKNAKYFGEPLPFPFNGILYDEIDMMKTPGSSRFRAAQRFNPFFKWRVGGTGTPTPNHLIEIWGPAHLVTAGEAFDGAGATKFKTTYFYAPNPYMKHVLAPLPDSDRKIYAEIEPYTFRIALDDEVRLPDLIKKQIRVEMPPKARKAYREMKAKLMADIDNHDPVVANSAAVKSMKLLQMASGFVYDTPDAEPGEQRERVTHRLHSAKYEALDNILSELHGAQVVVFYQFEEQLDQLKKRYGKRLWTLNPANVDRWERGEGEILALHPKSASHGLNLHLGGCRYMVFLTTPWSGGQYRQCYARIYRRGQKHKVVLMFIEAEDTIDLKVFAAQKAKARGAHALLEAMREATDEREAA